MNKEIKEILDRIETASEIFDCLLKPEECIELLDYLINLQNRITELEEINKQHQELNGMLNQKINKAIEYIDRETGKGIYESGYGRGTAITICKEHLLNILQDKEEV